MPKLLFGLYTLDEVRFKLFNRLRDVSQGIACPIQNPSPDLLKDLETTQDAIVQQIELLKAEFDVVANVITEVKKLDDRSTMEGYE